MNEIFIPPRSIDLGDFIYSYKDKLTNGYYTYRCKFRKSCNIVIKTSINELKKYLGNNTDINYEITSKIKEHTCKNEINKKLENNNKQAKINDEKELIKSLIFNNLEKNLSFHIDNLKNNNIILKRNQIKYLLQKYREIKFPSDEKYLKNISDIVITFDNANSNMINMPMCYTYKNFLNVENKNKLEKFIVITTQFQMNLWEQCTQTFIDGTFKSCPKEFYQVLNIAGFFPNLNSIVPLFMIPCTGKSELLYNEIFIELKRIYNLTGHKIENTPKYIMIDFEKSLQNSIKKNFENKLINGCFFHFVKLLWNKAKSFGLCTKNKIKNTKILVFIFKLFPFIAIDERICIFNKLEEYYGEDENRNNYKKYTNYYKKHWLNNKYINFIDLDNNEYLQRTNNYIESYHHNLNMNLEVYHPKFSYLNEKYKIYLIKIYNKIKESFVNKINIKTEKFSVVKDILDYIANFNKKHKTKINFSDIIQCDEDDKKKISKICDYLLDSFLDIYPEENEKIYENKIEIIKNEKDIEDNVDDAVYDNSDHEIAEKNDDLNDEYINFDEFYLKKIDKGKKNKKRNYIDAFGSDNELKKFWDNLEINSHSNNQI